MSSSGKTFKVAKSAVVPYAAEKMFTLVNHIEAYPEFLPWCSRAHVMSQGENTLIATMEIAKGPFREKLTTQNTLRPPQHIHMSLVEGPFTQLEGDWFFMPKPGCPTICQVSLDLVFSFPSGLAATLLTPVFQGIANKFVDAFSNRAQVLYG